MKIGRITVRSVEKLTEPVLGIPAHILEAQTQRSLNELRERHPEAFKKLEQAEAASHKKNCS